MKSSSSKPKRTTTTTGSTKKTEVAVIGGGGLKGFLKKAGKSFYSGGIWAKDWLFWTAQKSGRVGFIFATTSVRFVKQNIV